MDPFLVVGLGNPGAEYEGTRHNLGFEVVDVIVRRSGKVLRPGRGEYLVASCRAGGREVLVVKPLSYMNNSGIAVEEALERYGVSLAECLVVCDDFALPLGSLRIRARGSDGGHNGLASIIYHLQTAEFPRMRCGIRKELMPGARERADFVLSPFDAEERPLVDQVVMRAADAAIVCALDGIARAMSRFNTAS